MPNRRKTTRRLSRWPNRFFRKHFLSRYAGAVVAVGLTAGIIPIAGVAMERLVPEGVGAYIGWMLLLVTAGTAGAMSIAAWWERHGKFTYIENEPGDQPNYRALIASIGQLNNDKAPSLTSLLAPQLLRQGEEVFVYLVGVDTDKTSDMENKVATEFQQGKISGVSARFVRFVPFENSADGIDRLIPEVGQILEYLKEQYSVDVSDVVLDYTGGLASITSALVQCGLQYKIDLHYYFNPAAAQGRGNSRGQSILSKVRRETVEPH